MPGRYTIPLADIALILGICALAIAAGEIGRITSHLLAPSARRAFMLRRFCHAPVGRPCRSRLTPVIVLPRIMPIIRMVYLGLNQGSSRTCFVSANTATRIKAVIIAVVPSPYPQMSENRRSYRANASQPANMIMMSTATPVQSGDVGAKRPLRTSPINRSYATIRRAAINNLPSRQRCSQIKKRAAPSTTNRRQSPKSRCRER